MKSLKESIDDSINESMWAIAGGVIAGIIGWKIIKGMINGGAKALMATSENKLIAKVESEYIPQMQAILEKYPMAMERITQQYHSLENAYKTASRRIIPSTVLDEIFGADDWHEEDKISFEKAFNATIEAERILMERLESAFKEKFGMK